MGVSQTYQLTQGVINNIIQQSDQSCTQTSSSSADNNTVYGSGLVIGGDFVGVSNAVTSDVSCMITSNMESTVENMLESVTTQNTDQSTSFISDVVDLFSGSDVEGVSIGQQVTNAISQLNEATCQASQINSASNNLVYLTDSTVLGNYTAVSNSTDFKSSCTLSNIARLTVEAKLSSDTSQDYKKTSAFWDAIKVALVAGILIIAAVVLVILLVIFKPSGGKNPAPIVQAPPPSASSALVNTAVKAAAA